MFGRSWGRLEAELAKTLHETFGLVADRLPWDTAEDNLAFRHMPEARCCPAVYTKWFADVVTSARHAHSNNRAAHLHREGLAASAVMLSVFDVSCARVFCANWSIPPQLYNCGALTRRANMQVRALVYVTTLGNGIMESMAHLEKAVVAALGPRQHKRHASGDGARKDRRTSEDARVCLRYRP